MLDATWIHEHTATDIATEVKRLAGDRPTYVTFDIDFVDPAFAPGTGTPVPGGPDSYKSREILIAFDAVGLNVVAADLVEVAPIYDGPGEITSLLGAALGLTCSPSSATRAIARVRRKHRVRSPRG